MKKLFFLISLNILVFLSFGQEAEMRLPEVTTFIPGAVEQKLVITAEEIEAAHYEDLGDLLERVGIQILSYGPYGLERKPSIRGFTDETVRVVIDGICVNNAQYGTFDFSTINIESVEKLEIIRGGFTEGVEDEGAVGGVIYITMKKNEMSSSLKGEAGLKTFFNTKSPVDSAFQKIAYSGRLGESSFLNADGSLNYAANRYIYKYDSSGAGQLLQGAFGGAGQGKWKGQKNAQVTDGSADAALTHYFGDGNYFSFGEIFYAGHKNTPGPANSANPGLQRDYNNNLTFTLWNPAVGQLFNLKNSAAWLCNNRFYKDRAGTEDSRHNINTFKYTGSADFTSLADGRLRQLVGLSADCTVLDSTNDGQHLQFSGVLKETSRFAAGGGWSFSLPLAAKLCLNDNNANFAFVPKAGVAWENDCLRLFTDVYRMVQFPNMDDLFWEGGGFHGNPKLKPESGWGVDLGVAVRGLQLGRGEEASPGTQLGAGLTLFSNYYKDKIQWSSGTTQNLSSAFYFGIDFNLAADFFAGLWTLDINGEYLYTRLLDQSNKLTYGKQIMWTPDFTCTVVNSLNFELAKISLTAAYTGRRYTSNLNVKYLEPYLLVGLAAEGAAIRGKFTPWLKLDNLLNWQYQSVESYTMPGISFSVGGRYSFF